MLQKMMHPLHLYDAYLGVVESTMFIAEDIEESNSQVARPSYSRQDALTDFGYVKSVIRSFF